MDERRYRMVVEMAIRSNVIDEQAVREEASGCSNLAEVLADPWTWERAHAMEQLRRALLNEPELLERYLRRSVLTQMEVTHVRTLAEAAGIDIDERVELRPEVRARLDEASAELINEFVESDSYMDNSDLFWMSFPAAIRSVAVEPVDPVPINQGLIDGGATMIDTDHPMWVFGAVLRNRGVEAQGATVAGEAGWSSVHRTGAYEIRARWRHGERLDVEVVTGGQAVLTLSGAGAEGAAAAVAAFVQSPMPRSLGPQLVH